jgi:ACS family sodium-dependent inorganic phosphate cotransporter
MPPKNLINPKRWRVVSSFLVPQQPLLFLLVIPIIIITIIINNNNATFIVALRSRIIVPYSSYPNRKALHFYASSSSSTPQPQPSIRTPKAYHLFRLQPRSLHPKNEYYTTLHHFSRQARSTPCFLLAHEAKLSPFINSNGNSSNVLQVDNTIIQTYSDETSLDYVIKFNNSNNHTYNNVTNINNTDISTIEVSSILTTTTKTTTITTATTTRNTVITLTVLVAALSALDRVAMSVAILPMATEYGLTETSKGQISSVFSLGYGLGIIPAGILLSFVSPKIVMATGVTLWSLATLATPWAASYLSTSVTTTVVPLLMVRTVMGLSESVVLPTVQKILFLWVPPETNETSITVASVFGGFQVGTIFAYAISPYIIDIYDSWKGIFYIYGAVGFLWLLPWLLFVPPPQSTAAAAAVAGTTSSIRENNHKDSIETLNSDDVSVVVEPQQPTSIPMQNAPFKAMVTSKGVIAMTIAHAANNWGLYTNLAWSPTFYQEQYSLNVHDSALYSILPSVAGAIGGVVAGTIADNLLKKGADRTTVRKLFQGLALFGAAFCLSLLTYIISNSPGDTMANHNNNTPVVAQSLLTCAVGLQSFNAAGYGASAQEKAGDKWAGLLYSVTSLPGVIMGSIAVYATGQMLDYGLGWNHVFGLNVMVDVAGAICFIALYDSNKEFD